MRRIGWVLLTAQDGAALGIDEARRGFEIRDGELHRLPDPPPLGPGESIETALEQSPAPSVRRPVSKRAAKRRTRA